MELRAEVRAKSKADRNDRMAYLFGKFPDLKETMVNEGQKIKVVKNHHYRVYLQQKILKAYENEKESERESENESERKRIHLQLRHRPTAGTALGGIANAWDSCVFRARREEERLQREIIHGTKQPRQTQKPSKPRDYTRDDFGIQGDEGEEEDFRSRIFSLQRKFSPYCIDIEDDTLVDVLQIGNIVAAGPEALSLSYLQKLIFNFFSFTISDGEARILHARLFRGSIIDQGYG